MKEPSDEVMLKVPDWRAERVVGAVDAATDSEDEDGVTTGLVIELADSVRLLFRIFLGAMGGGERSTIPSEKEEE